MYTINIFYLSDKFKVKVKDNDFLVISMYSKLQLFYQSIAI